MGLNPFKFLLPKKFIGVDIGTSAIKIVELSRWGKGKTLENYGEVSSRALFEEGFQTFNKTTHLLSERFTARAIQAILQEAKIRTKSAIFSIPDFSTFFTSFELPPMTGKEIPEAVQFTAPQYIPLSIQETTLDWRLIEGNPGDKKSHLRVLVVAIPNEVIESYKRTAKMAGLELYALEAEVFGIIKSSVKDVKKVICLTDIGAQSSTISIVDNGVLKKSYSSEFSSNQLTYTVATSLNVEEEEAEEIKKKYGIISSKEKDLRSALTVLIDPFLTELRKVSSEFYQAEGKKIEVIYLSGGGANLPGLKDYISENLKKKTVIPDAFADVLHPPILTEHLKEMGPRFSIAVGMALQGLEG